MSRKLKITIIIACVVAALLAATYWFLIKTLEPKIPEPKSDVPITYKIGWWGYQDDLVIDVLETKEIYSNLYLFNSKAVIEYRLKGTIKNKPMWKPYIKSVFLSERWLGNPENFKGNAGEVILTPVVGVKEDQAYTGERVSFDLKVQDYLQAGGWGTNTYLVKAQDKEQKIVLQQSK
ncbi:hypothetical protein ACJJI3_10375 [Microbulbifer sp. ZKSA004]|uniref:hypothetical protein n=1 Tax=Microbulbifer sp. ZKSA004 TaxID=3243389 RepID=UPI004039500E